MDSTHHQPALICPFTLIEEKALAWSILLCGQALLLHPFPLPIPDPVRSWSDQGLVQVRSLPQPPEVIREKDRVLREIKQYGIDNPEKAFLQYLKETPSLDNLETQEEIAGLLKGRSVPTANRPSSIFKGSVLLCLIHEWIMQEGEVETSLAAIEAQEKSLIQGWQENPEEGTSWDPVGPLILAGIPTEMKCPPALAAWREIKKALVPEPAILFTTQQWVWEDHYGLDPEECQSPSFLLPDLGLLNQEIFQDSGYLHSLRERMDALLHLSSDITPAKAIEDFQAALLEIGSPAGAHYRIIFPPHPFPLLTPSSPSGQKEGGPLLLLNPVRN